MMHKTEDVHISVINVGDVVLHNGKDRTVCENDISRVELLGITLFGDSYHAGHKQVKRVMVERAIPVKNAQ